MDPRSAAALSTLLGILVVFVAVTSFSPTDDRPMSAQLVEHDQGNDDSVVAYDALSSRTQDVVDDVIRSGHASLSTYDDYATLQELPRRLVVDRNGERYVIRTMTADGSGGLFEGLVHDLFLAIGGLALGSALYVVSDPRRDVTVVAFPALTAATIAGMNLLRAPEPTVLNGWSMVSFGIVVAVPVIAGLAIRRRNHRIGGIGILALIVSALVLLQGESLSILPHLVGLAILTIPGVIVGWRLGNLDRHNSLATSETVP